MRRDTEDEQDEQHSFNSRTPGGVRPKSDEDDGDVYDVSIHAPREGCDCPTSLRSSPTSCFNSRTPGGVRHQLPLWSAWHGGFQFTHPGRGATLERPSPLVLYSVSIHAPREGCDWRLAGYRYANICFNSRTPGGVRLAITRSFSARESVSIHAPREGCDSKRRVPIVGLWEFQFTHPGRGATY